MAEADFLAGVQGIDTLHGGAGSDELLGGAGGDFFDLAEGDGQDEIADFELEVDQIEFSGGFIYA